MLSDQFGRTINYLRVSVTDKCNLNCIYCKPKKGIKWLSHEDILRLEEIYLLCKIFVSLGIKKIRFTGGEPFLRKNFIYLLKLVESIEGLDKICITTNGTYIVDYIQDLINTKVRHINVSLDTLNREKYSKITGRDEFSRVWEGVKLLLENGFHPVKINMVVISGLNDDEIMEFAKLSLLYPLSIRFIEYMPLGNDTNWNVDKLLPCDQIKLKIEKYFGNITEINTPNASGPAKIYKINNSQGDIGFISAMSQHFCSSCNRIRLTADGKLRLCLFDDNEISLKKLLNSNISNDSLVNIIQKLVFNKPHGKIKQSAKKSMHLIGG